jgi:hypothetical protein
LHALEGLVDGRRVARRDDGQDEFELVRPDNTTKVWIGVNREHSFIVK